MSSTTSGGWSTRSFEFGRNFLAIRTNSPAIGEWLDVLGAYEVTDEETSPYYSLWAGERSGRSRGFHILYREAQRSLRTHDHRRDRAARCSPSSRPSRCARTTSLRWSCRLGVIRRNGRHGAGAADPACRSSATAGRCAERELDMSIPPYMSLDVETAEFEPYRQRLDVPADAADRLAAFDPGAAGTQREARVPGRPDLADRVPRGRDAGAARCRARAGRIRDRRASALNLHHFGGAGLDAVARSLEGIPLFAITPGVGRRDAPAAGRPARRSRAHAHAVDVARLRRAVARCGREVNPRAAPMWSVGALPGVGAAGCSRSRPADDRGGVHVRRGHQA